MQKDWSFLHSLDLEKKPTTKNNNTIVCYANVSISFCLKFDHGFLDFSNCLSLSFSLLNKMGMIWMTYHFFGINFTDGFTKLKLHNFFTHYSWLNSCTNVSNHYFSARINRFKSILYAYIYTFYCKFWNTSCLINFLKKITLVKIIFEW